MAAFHEVLANCSLQDLGFHGAAFTWSNMRLSGDLVRVRLDRSVANAEWISLFPNARVQHIVVAASDHMGLLIHMDPAQAPNIFKKKIRFRFEHMWSVRQVVKMPFEKDGVSKFRVPPCSQWCRKLRTVI